MRQDCIRVRLFCRLFHAESIAWGKMVRLEVLIAEVAAHQVQGAKTFFDRTLNRRSNHTPECAYRVVPHLGYIRVIGVQAGVLAVQEVFLARARFLVLAQSLDKDKPVARQERNRAQLKGRLNICLDNFGVVAFRVFSTYVVRRSPVGAGIDQADSVDAKTYLILKQVQWGGRQAGAVADDPGACHLRPLFLGGFLRSIPIMSSSIIEPSGILCWRFTGFLRLPAIMQPPLRP